MNKKYLRPKQIKQLDGIIEVLQDIKKEIKELYGINTSTLSQQRWGLHGLPFNIVGHEPSKRNGGVILHNIDEGTRY